MPYWQNITRSFVIVGRHRYLWLLALFAGEGGGANFSYGQATRPAGGPGAPGAAAHQLSTWVSAHWGLIAVLAFVWLILIVALFLLAAVCEGALIRGAAEHDAQRPFGLDRAWTSGLHTMWLMVRFRLLLLALAVPAVVVVAGIIAGGVIAALAHDAPAAVSLILLGALLGLFLIVYLVYLGFLDRFGARSAILEERGAVASLVRAHHLLFQRLGRSLLVWLLSIAVAIGAGIGAAVVYLIAGVPLAIAIAVSAATRSPAWPLLALGVVVLLAVALPVAAFVNAQASTYWTLSFRRMEIDYPPAYRLPPQPAAQP